MVLTTVSKILKLPLKLSEFRNFVKNYSDTRLRVKKKVKKFFKSFPEKIEGVPYMGEFYPVVELKD